MAARNRSAVSRREISDAERCRRTLVQAGLSPVDDTDDMGAYGERRFRDGSRLRARPDGKGWEVDLRAAPGSIAAAAADG